MPLSDGTHPAMRDAGAQRLPVTYLYGRTRISTRGLSLGAGERTSPKGAVAVASFIISSMPGVARFAGYMVVCSLPGRREWLGTYRRWREFGEGSYPCDPVDPDDFGIALRPFLKNDIAYDGRTGNAPSVFFDRERLRKAIRNAMSDDLRRPKRQRRSFRIIAVTVEVKLRMRVPVGLVGEPALIATFRQTRTPRERRRGKSFSRRSLG